MASSRVNYYHLPLGLHLLGRHLVSECEKAVLRRIALHLVKRKQDPKSRARRSVKRGGGDNSFLEALLVG